MDWKIFFLTFGTIFLAELGDKTQLATLTFSSQAKSPWIVFAASALALTLSSFLAVMLGQVLEKYIPAHYLKIGAGVSFIVIGGLLLFSIWRGGGA
ncbi:MAG: TMEM165/GDT1 family protein [bacterium]